MAFQIIRSGANRTCSAIRSQTRKTSGALLVVVWILCFTSYPAQAAAPIARDDDFSTGSGQQVNGLLSSNDEHLDGPADSFAILTSPSNGIANVNADGSFSYTPNVGFAGSDSFRYEIDDGAGGVSSAAVGITVAAASDFISATSTIVFTPEDTAVALGLVVAPDLYDGGALQDLISTDAVFRNDSAGATPIVSTIPAGASSIAITGYSTQSLNTSGDDLTDDDYQLLNARINLVDGTSSGRVAFINNGGLYELDQYAWKDVPLGQSILTDTNKVTGFYATGASDPNFSVISGALQIVETHSLETAYVIEYMTSDGDSTNFLGAGNTVQTAGVSSSVLSFPMMLEPVSGKKGFIALNATSAAAGTNFAVEHKGFARLLIDLEARSISGSIAAQRGENSANTVTYSFEDYPLLDQRITSALPTDILTSGATIVGDTTADASVLQNPTLYIDTSGQLVIERASDFAAVFTSMYTAEYYERTGYSSIASFVSVGSADSLFDASPVDGVDEFGDPINEFVFTVPASARVGLLQMSWNTIGGSDTNENMGTGFAVVDLESGISSGSVTFIRTSTPDLLSWDGVPFGTPFFGAMSGGSIPLYQSNKSAGAFTDQFAETAKFLLTTNPDGSRTLTFSATSSGGSQNYRDYRGNANISWLGNEPFSISGVPTAGLLSHGAPDGSGGWEIDFADLPILAYQPAPHESGTLLLSFNLSSTGETENIELRIAPIVDEPGLTSSDATGYAGNPFAITILIADSADIDGSEDQPDGVTLSNVPASVSLDATAGSVTDLGGGVWLVDRASLATLVASSPTAVNTTVTVSMLQRDQTDVDGDLLIEDGDNGNGVDEYDDVVVSDTFSLRVLNVPTVKSLLVNDITPVLSGTAVLASGEALSVNVNGIVYPDTGPDLVVNGDGTWTLAIPAANALAENTYTVTASLAHVSGTFGSDTTADELVIDLTPPPTPGITRQTTNDDTPTLSGTVAIASGNTLRVEVDGFLYTQGDGRLVDNTDGTWELQIPAANRLSDALYQITATLTDAAGNVTTDHSADELLVDTVAPLSPSVISQSTNDTTPIIRGTATLGPGETLSVEVNEVVYTVGGGALVVHGDGTWSLNIPLGNALFEGVYSVVATATDLATNVSTDLSSNEIMVDLTAPIKPTITTQLTNQSSPTLVGTALVGAGETLTVIVGGVVYVADDGHLVDNSDGTWALTIPPADALPEGVLDVTVTVSDAAGNRSSDSSLNEIEIDLTPPLIPTVISQITANPTPIIEGGAIMATGDVLSVDINGISYKPGDGDLMVNADGTWLLIVPTEYALTDGSYNVWARVSDAAGNIAIDASSGELVVDLTPPPAPGVTSQSTSDATPVISGTTEVASGLTLRVEVDGITYLAGDGNLIDNGDGTWDLTIPPVNALVDALYQLIVTLTDTAGNVSTDSSIDELLIDTMAPPSPGVTSLTTNQQSPIIQGTAVLTSSDTLTVDVNSVRYTAGDGYLIDHGDGTWSLSIPSDRTLGDGLYSVTATVTDLALNASSDPSSSELLIDTLAPASPAVVSQITNLANPAIEGTALVLIGEILTVEVNGTQYRAGDGALLDNGNGTWSLTIPPSTSLPEGVYDVTVTITDGAGNRTSDSTNNELEVDLTPPLTPAVNDLMTNSVTPTVTGTATVAPGEILGVIVNGVNYVDGDGHLTGDEDGTWTLSIPAGNRLPDGTHAVIVTIQDTAGNSSNSLEGAVHVDTVAPTISVMELEEATTYRPVLSGTANTPDGSLVQVHDSDDTLVCETVVVGGDWSCETIGDLSEGSTTLVASTTDEVGNAQSVHFSVVVSRDFDRDGIVNSIEGFSDSDGDGIVDSLDRDSDNDGLLDQLEGTRDTDNDGLPDYLDQDSDNDGIADAIEALGMDIDGDFRLDGFIDTDGDGVSDLLQTTPLSVPDTDDDGIPDYRDIDSDQDGIPDIVETLGADLDDNGRVDTFTDTDVNGVDDAVQVIRAQLVDSDGDGLPDYRDLDSDNDGIADLVEVGGTDINSDGVVDSASDINGNGIPDSVDVYITLGDDIDGDGIDDLADASISFGDDSDGDGILDTFDPDSNGDGRADTALSDLLLGAAVPDTDLDGTPDFQQAIDGTLRTGLTGHGGCSIVTGLSRPWDPSLMILVSLAMLGIAFRTRRVRHRYRANDSCNRSAERAEHTRVIVALILLLAASFVSANSLQLSPYVGIGLGQSWLEPDASEVVIESVDNTDRSVSGLLGLDLSKRLAVEIGLEDLGQAQLTDDVQLGYRLSHASLLVNAFRSGNISARHRGFGVFGRIGVGRMRNKANFPYVREHDTHLLFGGGLEYGFSNGVSVRADFTTFDADAHRAGVFLVYRPVARQTKERDLNAISVNKVDNRNSVVTTQDGFSVVTSDGEDKRVPVVNSNNDSRELFVLFDSNSSVADMQAKVTAVNIAAAARLAPELGVNLTGYADTTGTAHYNLWLAERRVRRVRDLLELRGVESDRINSEVLGETSRFSISGNAVSTHLNRRVQIQILPKSLP